MPVRYLAMGTVNGNDKDAFIAAAQTVAKAVDAEEPGCEEYSFYVTDDGSSYVAVEQFADKAAVFAHLEHMQSTGLLEQFLAVAPLEKILVLSDVDDELKGVFDQFGGIYTTAAAAISR